MRRNLLQLVCNEHSLPFMQMYKYQVTFDPFTDNNVISHLQTPLLSCRPPLTFQYLTVNIIQ